MNHSISFKTLVLASSVLAVASVALPTARADEWNKRTIMTIDKPILTPHKELQPGTYVVKLLNSESNRDIVQIFDKDEKHLITTILAIPNYRLEPTGKTKFSFWETPAGEPPALRAWFYPGDNFGHEFAYPKEMVAKLQASNKEAAPTMTEADEKTIGGAGESTDTTAMNNTPPVTDNSANNSATTQSTAPVTTNTGDADRSANPPAPPAAAVPTPPVNQPETVAQNAQPSTPPVTDNATPQPTDTTANNNSELPRTASDYPAIALAGFASLLAFAILTFVAKKRREA